jgi:hypothetical protein
VSSSRGKSRHRVLDVYLTFKAVWRYGNAGENRGVRV